MYPKAAAVAGLMLASVSHGSPLAGRAEDKIQMEAWNVHDDSYNIVVGCDVPDGDNFPEVLHTLLATDPKRAQPASKLKMLTGKLGHRSRKIAIVLEGREVNFGALHFSQAVGADGKSLASTFAPNTERPSVITSLFQRVGVNRLKDVGINFYVPFFWMVSVYDNAWAELMKLVEGDLTDLAPYVPRFLKTWFEISNASEDKDKAAEDEQIYMQVSKIRLIKMLDSFGVDRERYHIWTKAAAGRLRPGIKPAQHVQDWRWGLSEKGAAAVAKCQREQDKQLAVSEKRAECIRDALKDFANDFNEANKHSYKDTSGGIDAHPGQIAPLLTLKEEADATRWGQTFAKFFDNGVHTYRYLLGGPVSVLKDHLLSPGRSEVTQAVAMLQSFVPDINVLLVQYNHYIDQDASKYTMEQAVAGKFTYFLSPTEISKRSPYTFRFEKHNGPDRGEITMEKAFGDDNPIFKLEDDFTKSSLLPANLFDMHAGISAFRPDLYPKAVRVEFSEDKDIEYNGVPFIRLKPAGPLSPSKLYVQALDLIDTEASSRAYFLIHNMNDVSNSHFGPGQGAITPALAKLAENLKTKQPEMIKYLQAVFKEPDYPFKQMGDDPEKGYHTQEATVPIGPFLGNLAPLVEGSP